MDDQRDADAGPSQESRSAVGCISSITDTSAGKERYSPSYPAESAGTFLKTTDVELVVRLSTSRRKINAKLTDIRHDSTDKPALLNFAFGHLVGGFAIFCTPDICAAPKHKKI